MPDPSHGTPPQVINTPTLGNPVRLGELYDQRAGTFLGVQLYSEDKIKEFQVEADVKHTDLTVKLAKTHEDKTSLLDIHAELSLDILGGLVKVSGSASYINDEKSNTQQYAYAMSLKMRLKEKRLLFAEEELARHVLRVAVQDYVQSGLATHFVSSIVFGGSFFANMIARQSEFSKDDLIEGKLEAELGLLKGAVDLHGEVDITVKNKYKHLDDKFDLVIHGDVALDKVPINPKDVLDTFPDSAKLITDNGGVPISVTLQPIPKAVHDVGLVYELDAKIVDVVLDAFSNLDDLRSRFLVLDDNVKKLQDFVPELARTTRVATTVYINKHIELLHKLGAFLLAYHNGERPDHGVLLDEVTGLYKEHINPDAKDPRISGQYPSSLVGLEHAFSWFQNFVSSIQSEKEALQSSIKTPTLNAGVGRLLYLSTFGDVVRSIRIQRKIPLFIMIPLSASNHNLAVIKFLAHLRNYVWYFDDPTNPPHLLYAENLDNLEHELSDGEKRFPKLDNASVVLGTVDYEGGLTWHASPLVPVPGADVSFALQSSGWFTKDVQLGIDPVDGTKTFTIQFQARRIDKSDSTFCLILRCHGDGARFLSVGAGSAVFNEKDIIVLEPAKSPGVGDLFMGTFVQDTQKKQRVLYLNGDEVARKSFTDQDIVPYATDPLIRLLGMGKVWGGELLGFKAFTRALGEDEVRALYLEWKK